MAAECSGEQNTLHLRFTEGQGREKHLNSRTDRGFSELQFPHIFLRERNLSLAVINQERLFAVLIVNQSI